MGRVGEGGRKISASRTSSAHTPRFPSREQEGAVLAGVTHGRQYLPGATARRGSGLWQEGEERREDKEVSAQRPDRQAGAGVKARSALYLRRASGHARDEGSPERRDAPPAPAPATPPDPTTALVSRADYTKALATP